MPEPTITNAVLHRQVTELLEVLKAVPSNDGDGEVKQQLIVMEQQLKFLTDTVERSLSKPQIADRCPFRDDIRRASNNLRRLDTCEARIEDLRLTLARAGLGSGLAGGGVVTVAGGIIIAVGKALGWW